MPVCGYPIFDDKGNAMSDLNERFLSARRKIIDAAWPDLNPQQLKAVKATEGPLLILAGAGSGKTTVLIRRIASLLKFGRAADSDDVPFDVTEEDVELVERYARLHSPEDRERAEGLCALDVPAPWQIIAITFTNKAADELVSRLEKMLGPEAADVWASTFHSACVRILRRYVQVLGLFGRDFTIYDTADSQSLIKRILKDMDLDEKKFTPRSMLSAISAAKNAAILPEKYLEEAGPDLWKKTVGQVYMEYRKRMLQADAMDFDDLLLYTVLLLENSSEAREYYQRRFRYVLVDEYQDTNILQYRLVHLLAGERQNLCVVGDDDQGIYKFRGATIQNILDFEKDYPGARVIKLEQNYRSTGTILDAANAVIRENRGRKGKTLWTDNERGEVITLFTAASENDEAQYIAGRILADISAGGNYRDHAVLYRVNALSNRLEYALKRNGIPYRIYGGTRFYDRAEVKDMLAYLCVVANPGDTLRLRRIINQPPRGIGDTTVERAAAIALGESRTLYEVLQHAEEYPELKRSAGSIRGFVSIIEETRQLAEGPLDELYDFLLQRSGYVAMLEAKDLQENVTRLENVLELKSNIVNFMKERSGGGTLQDFLDEMALYSDTDEMSDEDNRVSLMTMHSAKGLEFPTVYIAGAEDGLFPGLRSIGDDAEMEEERRLCYVAVTRARKKLYITNARQRMVFGRTQNNLPSRFISSVPEELMERLPKEKRETGGWSTTQQSKYRPAENRLGGYNRPGTGYSHERSPAFSASRPAPKTQPKSNPPMKLSAGDTVDHIAFGRGTVLGVRPMGPDCILEIAFEREGTKKLMLSSAGKFMKKL